MNIFFNISHPAHVHFFKYAIKILRQKGHNTIIGARDKEFTTDLLRAYEIEHIVLTKKGRGALGLLKELLEQQWKISKIVKKYRIDIMLQISGIFNAPVGRYYGIPSLAFSDTENDQWANRLSFPLSKYVFSPDCFDSKAGGSWKNQITYPGYHELAYLSPDNIEDSISHEDRFLIRFVGWEAGHDIGEKGLSKNQKIEIVNMLSKYGSVHISSEGVLPKQIDEFAYTIHPSNIHCFMQTCKVVVGESATMASEAACLGIPAVFISNAGRGYTTEQDQKYDLIKHYRLDQWEDIISTLQLWAAEDLRVKWQQKRWSMLRNKINVTSWLVDLIENFPKSVDTSQEGSFGRYAIKCVE